MSSKAYIVTGASRGLGLAIAQLLLRASHKVFLVARSEAGLQKLKSEHPSDVEYMAADLADLSVSGGKSNQGAGSYVYHAHMELDCTQDRSIRCQGVWKSRWYCY